jgi:hypothetical protein
VEAKLGPPIERIFGLREAFLTEPDTHGLAGDLRPGGPTDLYNLFDRPDVDASAIQELRAAHRALLDAVLAAYGWNATPKWTFERPWIDGTLRYVPDAATRAVFVERLAALNTERYTAELGDCAEHLAAVIPKTGVKTKKLDDALEAATVRLAADEQEAALEEAVRRGLVRSKAGELYRV